MPDPLPVTHYEELGLADTASPEEIRRAHRILCRLLHPDHQSDETLRRAAEVQMRRVNAMVEMLLDPHRRRLYDERLRGGREPVVLIHRPAPRRPARRSSPMRVFGVFAVAVALALVAIWVAAGDGWSWHGPSFLGP